MARVVVDANVLIAARLSRDQHHDAADAIVGGVDGGDLPTAVVLDDVLEEVVNYLQARATHEAGVQTLDAIVESSGFEIVHTAKRDFTAGRSVYRKYQCLSLTDAIIVAWMQHQNSEFLYSFDDGFDAVDDVTRLTTSENPFD